MRALARALSGPDGTDGFIGAGSQIDKDVIDDTQHVLVGAECRLRDGQWRHRQCRQQCGKGHERGAINQGICAHDCLQDNRAYANPFAPRP